MPTLNSGPIPEAPGETGGHVQASLHTGSRGLAGGSSLAKLLMALRGVRRVRNQSHLTIKQILHWADEHFQRLGKWPGHSGPVRTAPGQTWAAINQALRLGLRGLPGGTTLYRLLVEHRRRNRRG